MARHNFLAGFQHSGWTLILLNYAKATKFMKEDDPDCLNLRLWQIKINNKILWVC